MTHMCDDPFCTIPKDFEVGGEPPPEEEIKGFILANVTIGCTCERLGITWGSSVMAGGKLMYATHNPNCVVRRRALAPWN